MQVFYVQVEQRGRAGGKRGRRRRRWPRGDNDKGMDEKGLIDPMYSKSPSQQRHGPDLQGGMLHGINRLFEVVCTCGIGQQGLGDLAIRIGRDKK